MSRLPVRWSGRFDDSWPWSALQTSATLFISRAFLDEIAGAFGHCQAATPRADSFKRIHLITKQITMLSSFCTKLRQFRGVGVAASMILAATPALSQTTITPVNGRAVDSLLAEKLSVAPGKVLTAQIVHYAPGGSSKAHYHDADVFAFVLSGNILSAEEGDEAKVYNVGEGHFERRGQHHVVSKNASMTEPASMLVVFISDSGAKLTTFDH
jgi:quercetin dioxygenase-like cupin family protein